MDKCNVFCGHGCACALNAQIGEASSKTFKASRVVKVLMSLRVELLSLIVFLIKQATKESDQETFAKHYAMYENCA